MEKRYYIAYGSNLNIPQMRMRCPGARIIGTSVIEGYRLLFKGSRTGSYLTIEPQEGARVPVAAWEVSAENEVVLDRYEGFPTFYYKKEMELPLKGIKTGKVRRRRVFVYIMHEDRPLGLPSRSYMETCRQGYRSFGFDEAFLERAYADSAAGEVLFGKLSAPTFFTLNAPVFQMVWINIQNFCICLRSLFKVSIV